MAKLTSAIRAARWWTFRRISEFGWWICPEPYKSGMKIIWRKGFDASRPSTPKGSPQ